jgi:RNA polymerase sigma-70 factor (ECF subfamily)
MPLDRMRREKRYREKLALPGRARRRPCGTPVRRSPTSDCRCCSDAATRALGRDAQLALTPAGDLRPHDRRRSRDATLTPESTIAQRIVRAKRKIGATGIPLRIPRGAERAQRLDIVLNRGVGDVQRGAPRGGRRRARRIATSPTTRSGSRASWPTQLPARRRRTDCSRCCCSTAPREGARASDGELVLLAEQDRTRWDRR